MTVLGTLAHGRRRGSRHGIDRQDYLVRSREFAVRGGDLPHAKLTDADVKEIRSRWKPYSRQNGTNAIAREYGVHPNTIYRLTVLENYYHVR